ncbi:LppU/SCO3897 family protein [Streptomyces echinatus]|uniref:LppU/SCO3897 family protein n=1 Tax=Streptomyces echinatus TaxID=67293 RepID=UPI0037B0EFB3
MPAAPVTVRGHQGMVVVMRFLRRRGVLCRTCGLAVFRQMQADTLVRGWWGVLSMLITPVVLLLNLGALSGIRRLPPPATAAWRPPLDPGRPVLRRPAGLFALIPLGGLAIPLVAVPVLMVSGTSKEPSGVHFTPRRNLDPLSVGACAHNDREWPHQDLRNVPCDSADAQYLITEPKNGYCAAGDYVAHLQYSVDGDSTLCLRPVKR